MSEDERFFAKTLSQEENMIMIIIIILDSNLQEIRGGFTDMYR
ncbi:hypothetical protein FDUTEX481_08324 [Tolypothrix sp. PCC 7601]|nr:hypothetical protein FDUTEX481_08324 [Tolypothrix sp. PCC 7601]